VSAKRSKCNKTLDQLLKSYALIGDDIVIADRNLATSYKETVQSLKMEINYSKTIESKDSFEFVKRFLKLGDEYSPLPLGELSYSHRYYWTISSFINKCGELGFPTHKSNLVRVITNNLFIGRKKEYIYNKTIDYINSINPYKDD
jgi:hypothetical protein